MKKLRNIKTNLGFILCCAFLFALQFSYAQETEQEAPSYITVEKGKTLYSIARENNVTVDQIKSWNNLNSNTLSIGQQLIVGYEKSETQLEPVQKEEAREEELEKQPIYYKVKKGETFYSISQANGVFIHQLYDWNNTNSNALRVGQQLVVGYKTIEREPEPEIEEEITEEEKPLANEGNKLEEKVAPVEIISKANVEEEVVEEPIIKAEPDTTPPAIPEAQTVVVNEIDTIPQGFDDTISVNIVNVTEPLNENPAQAQKKPKFYKSKALTITGRMAAQIGTYHAWGRDNRWDPFPYQFTANVNFNIFGINIPFSAIVSQQETSFLQPFNTFGASPNYKWVTVHAGYRNLQYSQFTLNNHLFLGAGADLNPEIIKGSGWKLRMSGMWGRFRRGIQTSDLPNTGEGIPVYKRTGYSAKLGVEKNGSFIDFILLKGQDQEASLNNTGSEVISPEENLVVGLTGQLNLFKKKITLSGDLAGSAYTRDTRSEESSGDNKFYSIFGDLFTQRVSSHYDYALNSAATYNGRNYNVGLSYSRITGDYRSMGSYFFQNDLEDLTANFSTRFLKGKASLSGSIGGQRTNISEEKQSTNKRLIASLNYNQTIKEKLNINLGFSNYSSTLEQIRDELTDSLKLYQSSRNYSLSINYDFGQKKKAANGIWLLGTYQEAFARQAYEISKTPTRFYNAAFGHQVAFTNIGFTISSSVNYTLNTSSAFSTYNLGPTISLSKQLMDKKMRLGFNTTYLYSETDGSVQNNIFRNAFSWAYTIDKHHSFNARVYHFIRSGSGGANTNSFSELRSQLQYAYTF